MSMREYHPSHSGPMNPGAAQPASFEAWQACVAPGDVFRHPREVLAHPLLSTAEKRTILAAWASDACAVENVPGLRCLIGCRAEPVGVDTVLATLAELDRRAERDKRADRSDRDPAASRPDRPPPRRRRRFANPGWYLRRGRRNDDDDPPPCPATIMPRPRTPPSAPACAAIPA